MTSEKTALRLHDSVIARIAQALQEALLSGTDVTDVLRAIDLKIDGQFVALADGYLDVVKAHHDKMLADLEKMNNE